MSDAQRSVEVVRVRGGARATDRDRAAAEEPLEIRLHDRPFAVIMRTPGADRELAAGFLLAERVLRSADDLGTIAHCTAGDGPAEAGHHVPSSTSGYSVPSSEDVASGYSVPSSEDVASGFSVPSSKDVASGFSVPSSKDVASGFSRTSNIVNVTLANRSRDAVDRLLADRRQVTTSSSCGLCGRQTIESLATDVAPVRSTWTVRASVISTLPGTLRARQAVFDDTGGLHAAGLFGRDGTLLDIAEDVGRHNAVDKIVGRMLMRDGLPLADHLLFVSGRTSFEIVQKAVVAGIPLVAAVSAPSTLAIDLAREFGVTLAGFVRGDGFNIYAHAERIAS